MSAASTGLHRSRARPRRYNLRVRLSLIAAVLFVTVPLLAQSPPSCPSNRPVDDYITEIHKSQSKKKARNKNPLPDFACVFGWCKQSSRTPPTVPEPAPRAETPSAGNAQPDTPASRASIKCDLEMQQVLDAAHDVDVGDTYFEEKNFRAALFRYQDAATAKQDDAAILVRLGRTYEHLDQPQQALQQYTAAAKLAGTDKWVEEARSALARMRQSDQH